MYIHNYNSKLQLDSIMNLLSHAKAYTCCACILAVRGGKEMKYTLQNKYMLSRVTQQDTRCKSNIEDDKASDEASTASDEASTGSQN